MGLKFIFVILCCCVVFILFLNILKRTSMNSTEKEFTYLQHVNSMNKDISLNVKFTIEPHCDSDFVIWIVTSSAEDSLSRMILRRAYSIQELKTLNIRRVFLLGTPKNNNTWKSILNESQKYHDILQGDFLEDYRNLTLKHLMGLKWASNNCTASFLIKTDDDIIVDVFEVQKLLQEKTLKQDAMSGYALRNMKPMRARNNKWFVTEEDFSENIYPDFLSGWFYITGLKTAQQLVSRSKTFLNFFWIDDIYVTGILRKKCGIKIEELNNLYTMDYRYLECCIRGKRKKLKCEFIAGPDGGKKELHIKFKEFSDFCQRNCVKRTKGQLVSETCVATYEENINIKNSQVQITYF